MGASAIRLLVAEVAGRAARCASWRRPRAASCSARTPSPTAGWARATIEATLKALEGFRRIMDTYGVVRYRAVATSAVREAANRDAFLDRVRLRTGHRRRGHRRLRGEPPHLHGRARDAARPPGAARRRRAAGRGGRGQRGHLVPAQGPAHPLRAPTRWARSACARASPPGRAATTRACACCAATSTTWWTTSAARCRCARRSTSSPWAATCASRPRRSLGEPAPTDGAARAAARAPSWPSATRSSPTTSSSSSSSYRLPQAEAETLVPGAARLPRAAAGDRRPRASRCPTPRCARACSSTSPQAEEPPGHRGLQPPGAGQRRRPGREVPLRRAARAQRGAARRCASSTSCAPSTACPTATACCWRWRRCCTTSATT